MLTRSIPFKPERRASGSSSSTTTGSTMNAGTPDSFDSSNPMHAARLDACAPSTGSCRSPTIASSTRYVPEGSGRSSPPMQAMAERLATATLWRVRKSLTIASRIGSWSMSETNWAIVAASCETVSVATGVWSSKIDSLVLVEPGLTTRIMNGKAASHTLNAPSQENYCLSAYPAADLDGLTDTLDCNHVSGHPHRDLVCLVLGVHIVDTVECLGHDTVKLLVDFLLRPVVTVVVLNPLEVGDGDTAGVAQNVRNDKSTILLKNLVCIRVDATIGKFHDDLRLDVLCIVLEDSVLESCRYIDVDVQRAQLLVGHVVQPLIALHGAVLVLIGLQIIGVDTLGIVDSPVNHRNGNDLCAIFLTKDPRSIEANVAKTLNGDSGALEAHPHLLCSEAQAIDTAKPGRSSPAKRSANDDGLACQEGKVVVSGQLAVLVHHPCHDLAGRVDIRSRNIAVSTDKRPQRADVSTGKSLEFAGGQLRGIDNDTSLATTIRETDDGALERHEGRHSLDIFEGLVLMESDAALGRSNRIVMLAAESLENLRGAIIHANRNGNAERPLWVAENLCDLGILAELRASNLNSVLSYLEPVFLLACHNSLRDVWCWLSGRMESRPVMGL